MRRAKVMRIARLKEADASEGLVRVLDLHDDDARPPAEGGEAEEDLPLEALDVDYQHLEARGHPHRRQKVVEGAQRRLHDLPRVVPCAPVEPRIHIQPVSAQSDQRPLYASNQGLERIWGGDYISFEQVEREAPM